MTSDSNPLPPREDCPAPLRWQDVLQWFREQSLTRSVRVSTRSGERRLVVHSQGEGPPLYFLKPPCSDSEPFCLLVWLLKDHFRCVLWDIEPSARLSSVGEQAEELFAIADELGDREFAIYATLAGCMPALAAMLKSLRVTRAVLQGGFAHRELTGFERLLCRAGCSLPGPLRRLPFWNAIQKANHRPYFPPNDPERWSFYLDRAGRTPIRRFAEQSSQLIDFDVSGRLAEIEQSTLLIRTENEGRLANAAVDALAAGMPCARVEPFHSAGQLPHLTHPHRLARAVRAFLCDESCETNCPVLNAEPQEAGSLEPGSIHA